MLTMNINETNECGEWSLYVHGSVRVTAKHISMAVNSSVLYEDVATTIDGGPDATPEQADEALIGCDTEGGSLGVLVNSTHPTYNSTAYKTLSAVTSGIVIKVVAFIP